MKKLWIMALLLGLFMIGTVNVKALNEEGLKEKLFQTIKVGNEEYSLSSSEKKIVETYLEQNEISDEDATFIGKQIDKAIEIIKAQKNTNFTSYPQSVKNELKQLVADISSETKVKATLTKEGLTVKNTDGSEIVVTKLVKQTGYETSKIAIIVAISFLVVAVGTGLVIKQIKAND